MSKIIDEAFTFITKPFGETEQRIITTTILYSPMAYFFIRLSVPEFEQYDNILKAVIVILFSEVIIVLAYFSLAKLLNNKFDKLNMYVCLFWAFTISIACISDHMLQFMFHHPPFGYLAVGFLGLKGAIAIAFKIKGKSKKVLEDD